MRKYLAVLVLICILLTSCTNKSSIYTIENVNEALNIPLIYNETMEQQLSDGRFSYWPDEVPEDIYSTYYSIETLKLLNYDYKKPTYNLDNLNQKITSLYDLYLFVSLFSDDIKSNENDVDTMIDMLNEYKINDYLYTIDKSYTPIYLTKDEVVLMATFYAISIYELLAVEYETDNLIDWYKEYFINCVFVENILDKYDQLYMLMCIMKFIENDISLIYNEIIKNFEQYEDELINNMDNANFIFYIKTYIDITNIANLERVKVNKDIAEQIIKSHTGENGGFIANAGELYNSLPMFIMVDLAYQYNLKINYEEVMQIILLHKRVDNYYIPYIIVEGDTISTYYSDYICNEITNVKNNSNISADINVVEFTVNNNANTILRIKELSCNYTPSYSTMDEIRILLENCSKYNISLIDIDLDNILNSTIEYLAELDDAKENRHKKFMANALIALIDYKKLDAKIYSEIKRISPSNLLESYHLCIFLDSLRIAGIDLSNYYDNNLIDDLTTNLYNSIDENGLFCTDNSKEVVTLSSTYMGMKVYEVVNYLLTHS